MGAKGAVRLYKWRGLRNHTAPLVARRFANTGRASTRTRCSIFQAHTGPSERRLKPYHDRFVIRSQGAAALGIIIQCSDDARDGESRGMGRVGAHALYRMFFQSPAEQDLGVACDG